MGQLPPSQKRGTLPHPRRAAVMELGSNLLFPGAQSVNGLPPALEQGVSMLLDTRAAAGTDPDDALMSPARGQQCHGTELATAAAS